MCVAPPFLLSRLARQYATLQVIQVVAPLFPALTVASAQGESLISGRDVDFTCDLSELIYLLQNNIQAVLKYCPQYRERIVTRIITSTTTTTRVTVKTISSTSTTTREEGRRLQARTAAAAEAVVTPSLQPPPQDHLELDQRDVAADALAAEHLLQICDDATIIWACSGVQNFPAVIRRTATSTKTVTSTSTSTTTTVVATETVDPKEPDNGGGGDPPLGFFYLLVERLGPRRRSQDYVPVYLRQAPYDPTALIETTVKTDAIKFALSSVPGLEDTIAYISSSTHQNQDYRSVLLNSYHEPTDPYIPVIMEKPENPNGYIPTTFDFDRTTKLVTLKSPSGYIMIMCEVSPDSVNYYEEFYLEQGTYSQNPLCDEVVLEYEQYIPE